MRRSSYGHRERASRLRDWSMLKGSPLSFLLLIVTSLPHALMACVCDPSVMDTEEQFRAVISCALKSSAAVFSAEVIEKDILHVKFKVEKSWKGAQKDMLMLSTGVTKVAEGIYSGDTCIYSFEKGKKYLVFAARTDHDH